MWRLQLALDFISFCNNILWIKLNIKTITLTGDVMYKAILLTVFILLSAISNALIADEIHKWTDENGRIHYGDKAHAAENSKVIDRPDVNTVIGPTYGSAPSASYVIRMYEMRSQFKQYIPHSAPVDTIPAADLVPSNPRCAELARQIVNTIGGTSSVPRKKISELCPSTQYQCRTYRLNSRANRCVAVRAEKLKDEGYVSNFVTD
ncbi:MAG: DUF4124 domain-containing protein [Agitococcus sp.]|nr:DUF4124 domain-containing protein [Agitococcus sp.]